MVLHDQLVCSVREERKQNTNKERGIVKMRVKLFHPTSRNTQLVGVSFKDDNNNWFELYFSYTTIITFHEQGHKMVVSQNVWSSTTGRHLNEIDGGGKEDRVDNNTFQEQLDEALERFFNA